MKTRWIIMCFFIGGLGACAKDQAPTIESLSKRKLKLETRETLSVDRAEVVEHYRDFLDNAPEGMIFGEAMRRLGDLELESISEAQLSGEAAVNQVARQLDAAIRLYETFLETYPNHKTNDLTWYQLARAYDLKGDPDTALKILNKIIKKYPDTRYIDEVEFRRGETLFVLRQYAKAEQAYHTIVTYYPQSVFYEKAIYKYGWAQFKQSKYKQALHAFISLLDRKLEQGKLQDNGPAKGLPRTERELLNDVLRVTSLSFSYLQGPASVSQYLEEFGERRYEPVLYRHLGKLYLAKERITDAADASLAFVERYPDSPLAPQFHEQAISAYKEGNFPSMLLPAKQLFIKQYGKDSRFWLTQDDTVRNSVQPLLMSHIKDLATHYHATARKTNKASDYQQAAQWYAAYLRSFPKDPSATKMNFLLAESLNDGKRYGEAINEFEKTAYFYPSHKNSAEAAYAALLIYPKLDKQTAKTKKLPLRQEWITSELKFTDQFPHDKRVPSVLSKTSEQLFALNEHERASATATRLIYMPERATPAQQRTAWTVLGHAQLELHAYERAEHAYTNTLRFMPKKSRKMAKRRAMIINRLAASIYKQGEEQRTAGNFKDAVNHFLRIETVAPTSNIRPTAEYDAATTLITMEDYGHAVAVLEDFRAHYKNHKLQSGVTEKLALAYKETGQGIKAAREMEKLVSNNRDPKFRQDMIWQAATLYKEGGHSKNAVRLYKQYVKQFPKPLPEAIEARHELAEHYRKTRQPKQWGHWLNEIIKTDGKGGAQRTTRTRYLAASATLVLAKPYRTAYKKARLVAPLKKTLKKKKTLMQKTIKAYQHAINYQVAEVTTSATYNIAEVYHDFARALMKSQRPKGLSVEELEQYDLLLEEQAFPFEEKAIDIHVANVKQIPDGIYDKWIKNSLLVLGELQPIRYAKTEKSEGHAQRIH